MSTYPEILEAALALPLSQRGELAEVLWESMAEEPDNGEAAPELSAAWRAEIARRSESYVRGELKAIPWQEAREAVLRKHRGHA